MIDARAHRNRLAPPTGGVIHVRGRRVGGARIAVAAQAHHLGQDRDAAPRPPAGAGS